MPKTKYNLGIDVPEVGQGRGAIVRTAEQIAAEQAQEYEDTGTPEYQSTGIQDGEEKRKRSFNLPISKIHRVKDMQQWIEREYPDRLPTEDNVAVMAIDLLYEAWQTDPHAYFPADRFQLRKKAQPKK